MKNKLKVGRRVISQTGIAGTVLQAGPYGTQPFQIVDEKGNYYSFINEDGTTMGSKNVWTVIKARIPKGLLNIISDCYYCPKHGYITDSQATYPHNCDRGGQDLLSAEKQLKRHWHSR